MVWPAVHEPPTSSSLQPVAREPPALTRPPCHVTDAALGRGGTPQGLTGSGAHACCRRLGGSSVSTSALRRRTMMLAVRTPYSSSRWLAPARAARALRPMEPCLRVRQTLEQRVWSCNSKPCREDAVALRRQRATQPHYALHARTAGLPKASSRL